jgi:hypothetical protein
MAVGLALVAAGLFALLRGGPTSDPPLDRIDADSRRQLERVLDAAQREGVSR